MSTENVKKFLEKVESTPELQKKLKSIPKGGGQWSIAEIVKLASAAGFPFTAKDYEDALEKLLEEKHAANALSDSELAMISGGLMCVSSDGTNCKCCTNPKPKPGTQHPVTLSASQKSIG